MVKTLCTYFQFNSIKCIIYFQYNSVKIVCFSLYFPFSFIQLGSCSSEPLVSFCPFIVCFLLFYKTYLQIVGSIQNELNYLNRNLREITFRLTKISANECDSANELSSLAEVSLYSEKDISLKYSFSLKYFVRFTLECRIC